MDPIVCVFCKEELDFKSIESILITIEREEDGAGVWYEYWAHESCLPKELK